MDWGISSTLGRFNPRPAVRPGDASAAWVGMNPPPRFNPRPAVRPGDAHRAKLDQTQHDVSIRARP